MRLLLVLLLCCFQLCSSAQTWEEWTEQRKTQLKRLREQIAANHAFIDLVKKGYKIVTTGLHTIRDIKAGDFRLHWLQFDSLSQVPGPLRSSGLVVALLRTQQQQLRHLQQIPAGLQASGQFTPAELAHCSHVTQQLQTACLDNIAQLLQLLEPGAVRLAPADRLQRLQALFHALEEQVQFYRSFQQDFQLLALQRLTEQTGIDQSRRLR